MKDYLGPIFSIFTFFLGVLCGYGASRDDTTKLWHKEIIKHGAGQHNPITGEFEWKKPVIPESK